MKSMSLKALVAAGLLAGGMSVNANAADLGGNCCADLEERIAELEATTARKGNRKVSLTISGWVSQQVSVWDDGVETNAYVSDIGSTLNSNFKLTGGAKIAAGVSAGYVLHVEVVGNENLQLNGATDNSGRGLAVIQSFWFIKSDTLGKLSVGTQSSAYDNVAVLADGSGSLIFANYIMYDINGFSTRRNGALTGINWGSFASCQSFNGADALGLSADCDGVPNNNVRYDTPTFAGFSASASWGEDDTYGVAGRYAGEFSGVKIALAAGYYENSDDNGGTAKEVFERARGGKKSQAFQAGAYLQHVPSGLFVYGAYGRDMNDVTGGLNGLGAQQNDGENYYVKAGVRTKLSPLGATVFYGEYGVNDDKQSNALFRQGVTGSELTQYGVGIVQEIDAAAMSLFVNYRHYEAELSCGAAAAAAVAGACVGNANRTLSFDDADLVKMGAIINF